MNPCIRINSISPFAPLVGGVFLATATLAAASPAAYQVPQLEAIKLTSLPIDDEGLKAIAEMQAAAPNAAVGSTYTPWRHRLIRAASMSRSVTALAQPREARSAARICLPLGGSAMLAPSAIVGRAVTGVIVVAD